MRLLTLISLAILAAAYWYHRHPDYSSERALAAIFTGDASSLEAELVGGMPVDWRDESGRSLLFHSCGSHQIACVRLLLARGANPNSQDNWGWTSLIAAAATGDIPSVRVLLDADADPWHVADAGYDAEGAARNAGHTEIAELIARAMGPKPPTRRTEKQPTTIEG